MPADISISILLDWLGTTRCIVDLDIAAARSVRRDYLGLLAHPSFVFSESIMLRKDPSTLDAVIWINSRMLKVTSLTVSVSELRQCARISFYLLQHVRDLAVYDSYTIDADGMAHRDALDCRDFQTLLRLLPFLLTIDMSCTRPASLDYLSILALSGLSLKGVSLDSSTTGCTGMGALALAFSSTIEKLHFGRHRGIDAVTLNKFTSTCHQLKDLSVNIKSISMSELIAALGSGLLPLLKSLVFERGAEEQTISGEAVIAIFRHHPKLTKFESERSTISVSTCADLIALCPEMEEFLVDGFEYTAVHYDSPHTLRRGCKLHFSEASPMQAANVLKVASSCKYPVTELQYHNCVLENNDLRTVTTALGVNLRVVDLCLSLSGGNDIMVRHLTQSCPLLEELELRGCTDMTDQSLLAIADNCKVLSRLGLDAPPCELDLLHITDSGVELLLQKIGGQLITFTMVANLSRLLRWLLL